MGWNYAALSVPEITCVACIETIETLFENNSDVKIKVVLIPEKEAFVYYNENNINLAQIREQIEDVGFSSSTLKEKFDLSNEEMILEKRNEFIIEGMTCNSCTGKRVLFLIKSDNAFIIGTIRDVLSDKVLSCDISLETKTALINFDAVKITPDQIVESIEDCGFDARLEFVLKTL